MIQVLLQFNLPHRNNNLRDGQNMSLAPMELLYVEKGAVAEIIQHQPMPMLSRFIMSEEVTVGLNEAHYQSRILALTSSKIKIFDFSNLDNDVTQLKFISDIFQEQISHLQSHVFSISNNTALARTAKFIVEISRGQRSEICLPMTRFQIADYLGLTIETVSRSFSHLKKLGLVGFSSSSAICIMDYRELRRLSVCGAKITKQLK